MIFDSMDKNGFFPNSHCTRCNKPLDSIGDKYPSESYAGSFTGLCHKCQEESRYIVKNHFDGAITYSYPPHCPSFRRTREEYIGYPDCEECGGAGRIYAIRSGIAGIAVGGSYYKYCKFCFGRYRKNPLRLSFRHIYHRLYDSIKDKWEKKFQDIMNGKGIDRTDPDYQTEGKRIAGPLIQEKTREMTDMNEKVSVIYEEAKKIDHGVEYMERKVKETFLEEPEWDW